MTADDKRRPVAQRPEADAADEATGTASSAGRSSALPAEERPTDGAVSAHLPEEKPDTDPEASAGEPEAPVGPSRAHGDEFEEATAGTAPEREGEEAGDQELEEARDHERQLEHDLDELTAKAEKADAYLELAQRTKADFENYRKRAARETAAAQERGVTKLVKELLPAVDNLDRALEAAESVVQAEGAHGNGSASTLVSGIKLVHADVIAALARLGIERFSPEGERFDPQRHEAVAQQPIEGAEPGTVVEVYQRGYRLGDQVIRPARVLVAG